MASPITTKMPVPMIAPSPSAVRSSAPTERPQLVLGVLGVGDERVDRLGGEEAVTLLGSDRHGSASLA